MVCWNLPGIFFLIRISLRNPVERTLEFLSIKCFKIFLADLKMFLELLEYFELL